MTSMTIGFCNLTEYNIIKSYNPTKEANDILSLQRFALLEEVYNNAIYSIKDSLYDL